MIYISYAYDIHQYPISTREVPFDWSAWGAARDKDDLACQAPWRLKTTSNLQQSRNDTLRTLELGTRILFLWWFQIYATPTTIQRKTQVSPFSHLPRMATCRRSHGTTWSRSFVAPSWNCRIVPWDFNGIFMGVLFINFIKFINLDFYDFYLVFAHFWSKKHNRSEWDLSNLNGIHYIYPSIAGWCQQTMVSPTSTVRFCQDKVRWLTTSEPVVHQQFSYQNRSTYDKHRSRTIFEVFSLSFSYTDKFELLLVWARRRATAHLTGGCWSNSSSDGLGCRIGRRLGPKVLVFAACGHHGTNKLA